ncbi:rheacalcin-1-like [Eudromia elegans]
MRPRALLGLCLLGCALRPALPAAPCYGYFGREVPWRQAEGWCRSLRRGCHLASVLSAEEHRALAGFVRQCQRAKEEDDVWIGLQYRSKAWAWTDGSKMRYSAWDDDDFPKGKHCAVLEDSSGFLSWDDDTCSERNPFVCKFKG